jgi:hypothetical protein
MADPTRKPGSSWRILARDGERKIELANEGIFDELVINSWLHLEQMDDDHWWMRVGDAKIDVFVREDGTVEVSIDRDCYDQVADD